ncbi:DUF4352 domain-containing protein [Microlunatus antarcticus]|uniref:DUF4352 domain-containing protein n=1 Tax=Microlunatus antarcticus TaxID=53388 RepID=A0A7W5P7M7_9ACTN|nr:DUF4352 domain-containing protein [Microlunatus antarcticus]MBB3327725.1 hypothetical protein [Microlunatus antarcticus]
MADPTTQNPPGRRQQPAHAAHGELLTHHAPPRARPRRALVVRRWYQRKRVLLPLAALATAGVIIGIGGAGSGTPAPAAGAPATSTAAGSTAIVEPAAVPAAVPTKKATTATTATKKKAVAKAAEMGDSVKAGDWQLKVTDFDCGESEVGDDDRTKEAEGEFCLLEISAKNNGDSEGTISGDGQKLSDDDGKTYRSDLEAALYDDPDSNLLADGVDPGDTAKGTIVFDVPKKATITGVTLTGGGGSDGKVKVSLR